MVRSNAVVRACRPLGSVALACALAGCYDGAGAGASASETDAAASTTAESDTGEPTGDATAGEEVLDPGRVTMHRLNRTEYNNTVRDLLGTEKRPADSFPADDFGLGFDNIADVLSTSPLQAELYERAAAELIAEAMELPITEPGVWHVEAETALGSCDLAQPGHCTLLSNGEVYQTLNLPFEGEYVFSTRVFGQQAGPDLVKMDLSIDNAVVASYVVDAVADGPKSYDITIKVGSGVHKFAVAFTNDFYDGVTLEDRNLVVDWLAIVGPTDLPQVDNSRRARIMVCDPDVDGEDACLREVFRQFAGRAWRRPATSAEVERLMQFVAEAKAAGGTREDGLRTGLQAILVSPYFVYRVELDPSPEDLTPHPLTDWELATRLSYFLWSSMPDDALYAAAEAGTLHDPEVLRAQALRMLADEKARALIDNFAGQWWMIRSVPYAFKDVALFPQWDDAIKAAMQTELELFAESFFSADRDMGEMLTSQSTFVDERLAAHYGIPGVVGPEFVEVDVGVLPRQGLLTKAGLLSVLSHPNHTSPVKRGKWVLENLLCQTPPAPPPGVDTKLEPVEGATQRQILEAHRDKPECAGCHVAMDPLGFGLENYDPLGAWRDLDSGLPIDASGTLPDGTPFSDGLEMQSLIGEQPDFIRCVVRKTLIYALGRAVMIEDNQHLGEVIDTFTASDRRFSELVIALVTSDPFRKRRGEPAP